jgi:hypothetical protein
VRQQNIAATVLNTFSKEGENMLYPIMTTSRELIDLNGMWKFKLDLSIMTPRLGV